MRLHLVLACLAATVATADTGRVITGVVRTQQGAPVVGARVQAIGARSVPFQKASPGDSTAWRDALRARTLAAPVVAKANTSADGRFRLEVSAGAVHLFVTSQNGAAHRLLADARQDADLTLVPFALVHMFSSRVRELGAAVPEAVRVWVVQPDLGLVWPGERSGAGFSAQGVPSGVELACVVDTPGFAVTWDLFTPPDVGRCLFDPLSDIWGRVLSEGRAVEGARVRAREDREREVLTDADGYFRLQSVRGSTVEVTHADRVGVGHSVRGMPAEVQLGPSARLTVEVKDASTGALLRGVRLFGSAESVSDPVRVRKGLQWVGELPNAHFVEQAPGRYVAEELGLGGTYSVSAEVEGYLVPEERSVLVEKRATRAVVSLRRGARLTGTIVGPNGAPVPGAMVLLRRPGRENVELLANTGQTGAFELFTPAGKFEVAVDARGFSEAKVVVTLPRKQPLDFALQPAPGLLVQVFRPDGTPEPGASVLVEARSGDVWRELHMSIHENANAMGHVEVRPLEPGSYRVTAFGPGFVHAQAVAFEVGTALERVQLRLRPGLSIGGVVVDGDLRPRAGLRIVIGSVEVVTDAEGRFLARGFDDRDYSVGLRVPKPGLPGLTLHVGSVRGGGLDQVVPVTDLKLQEAKEVNR